MQIKNNVNRQCCSFLNELKSIRFSLITQKQQLLRFLIIVRVKYKTKQKIRALNLRIISQLKNISYLK